MPWPIIVALALSACASSPQLRWDNERASQEQFVADRYRCLQQSRTSISGGTAANFGSKPVVDLAMFKNCMIAAGYTQSANGRLAPPPGSAVDYH